MTALAGAIERKARELGVWTVQGTGELVRACERGDWFVCADVSGRGFAIGRSGQEWRLAEPIAALWLLVMEAGHTIEQPCSACEATGVQQKTVRRESGTERLVMGIDGWRCHSGNWETGESHWSRPCPTCAVDGKPTGRAHTPAHEVMLGALPSFDVSEHTMAALFDIEQKQPLREDIEVFSTKLELQGDPLGVLLALWLAGKLEGRHVLGVERATRGSTPIEAGGWEFAGRDPAWPRCLRYSRPILEANP